MKTPYGGSCVSATHCLTTVCRYKPSTGRSSGSTAVACAAAVLLCVGAAMARPPEISNIHPDFLGSGDAPKIITGEGFDPKSTRVWTWSPPSDEASIKEALTPIDKALPPLPARPPKGAHSTGPVDVESQVVVAWVKGAVMWVETAAGFSKPLLFHVSKPCWLSESKATPGSMIYVFGFGLRAPYGKTKIAITGAGGTFFPPRIVEARALRTADSRLAYFEVPKEIKPGKYVVYMHNGVGGQWGWRKAGDLEAVAMPKPTPVLDVRTFGAKGDGLANDREAILKAIAAASKAGGGTVFFPPGTYLTDETIEVLDSVTLRGASRRNSILQGFGDPAKSTNRIWYVPLAAPTSILRLRGDTSLESLTVQGATWKGRGGDSLIGVKVDQVENVTIVDCCLRADEEDPRSRRELYRAVLWVEDHSRRIKILSNEIFGALTLSNSFRADIIGNRIHGGGPSDVVTLGGRFSHSLIDDNTLTDTPGRICVGMGWNNYFRFNEIHQAFRSTWENAEEVYLVHGGVRAEKTIGFTTGASATTLVDTRQDWKPDFYKGATVMILSGRGFGQYRRILGNTKDTLTLQKPWNVQPDSTSEYLASPLFTENAFFANLNNSPCRFSLWLDCVANVTAVQDDRAIVAGLVLRG